MEVQTNALKHKRYVLFLAALIAASFAVQIMSVAVGWQIYAMTHDPLYLGYVGLVQFLPSLLLVLATGFVADHYNRRLIVICCFLLEICCATVLLYVTWQGSTAVWPIFTLLTVFGIARAFMNPASDALPPNLLPREALAHGISLSTLRWQLATIMGPVAGGLLYGISPILAYGASVALFIIAVGLLLLLGPVPQEAKVQETNLHSLLAGVRFIRGQPVVLGAISLDLFAVLLGGTIALLPIFASDILQVGPVGLGLLRAAPGIGSVTVGLWLARYSIPPKAGAILFVCVAGFGLATIIFGLSSWTPLSILALALAGSFDMISVYVRETLMQLWTPDEVRGRVNAVNLLFIGASNELGEFRAGIMAALIGAKAAVVFGGIGTIAVAALWSRLFPQLRSIKTLSGKALA